VVESYVEVNDVLPTIFVTLDVAMFTIANIFDRGMIRPMDQRLIAGMPKENKKNEAESRNCTMRESSRNNQTKGTQ
jgi:hypothetical protein